MTTKNRSYRLPQQTIDELKLVAEFYSLSSVTAAIRFLAKKESREMLPREEKHLKDKDSTP